MDDDIKYIIDNEIYYSNKLEDAKKTAYEKYEKRRADMLSFRNSEFERIKYEYNRMAELKLQEIHKEISDEFEELKNNQMLVLQNVQLKNKITGRIVTLILENRA